MLDFTEFQKVVETAQQSEAVKMDLKRALKKVSSAIEALSVAVSDMQSMLADDYVAERKPRKARAKAEPNANGEAKRRGRPKRQPAAE